MHNILLLYGAEDYLITQKLGLLMQSIDNAEFNLSIFQNLDNELQIVESCYQLPFMSDKRVVIVYGDLFVGEHKFLDTYINNPNETTVLAFVVPTVDKRKKIYKLIEKSGTIIEFKKLNHEDLQTFIMNYLLKKDYNCISQEVIESIIENTAYLLIDEISLHDIVSELNRLVDYLGTSKIINVSDVHTIIKPPTETNVFKLFPLITSKKASETIAYMEGLLKSGTSVMFIISQLLRPYRILYKLKTTGNVSDLGLNSFMVKDIAKNIDSISLDDIAAKIDLTLNTQKLIQTGSMEDKLALQVLVSNLLS